MSGDDTARLIYLVLLGSVIAGYFLVSNRDRIGQTMRQAVLWGLIFLGVIAAYGLWSDIRQDVMPGRAAVFDGERIEIPRAFDGHYYLILNANNAPVEFVVDTGATDIVLSKPDAARAGVDLDALVYTGMANTANGVVRTARTSLDRLELGPITDRNVTVWVNEGEMEGSLLGMAYLNRFEKLEISGGTMVLVR